LRIRLMPRTRSYCGSVAEVNFERKINQMATITQQTSQTRISALLVLAFAPTEKVRTNLSNGINAADSLLESAAVTGAAPVEVPTAFFPEQQRR